MHRPKRKSEKNRKLNDTTMKTGNGSRTQLNQYDWYCIRIQWIVNTLRNENMQHILFHFWTSLFFFSLFFRSVFFFIVRRTCNLVVIWNRRVNRAHLQLATQIDWACFYPQIKTKYCRYSSKYVSLSLYIYAYCMCLALPRLHSVALSVSLSNSIDLLNFNVHITWLFSSSFTLFRLRSFFVVGLTYSIWLCAANSIQLCVILFWSAQKFSDEQKKKQQTLEINMTMSIQHMP